MHSARLACEQQVFSVALGDMTPLFSAAMQGKLAEVERILSASRADLETKDTNGCTPLVVASLNGHLAVVEALVRAGAEKEAKAVNGFTPLTAASGHGHLAVAEALVRAGADKDIILTGETGARKTVRQSRQAVQAFELEKSRKEKRVEDGETSFLDS